MMSVVITTNVKNNDNNDDVHHDKVAKLEGDEGIIV